MSDTPACDEKPSEPSAHSKSSEEETKQKGNKTRGKKRKRVSSESSSDSEVILPDNALATDINVHASAVKNNLDDVSVRKILKKVVTNDHVLALVKLREEEEDSGTEEKLNLQPKLTRSKAKELKKVSPKSAAWSLNNLELTPIKHIHVKTRPEVKALIAQELPEDEDDDEYEPTHDESDDDHQESFSDLDSQPRTPATPKSMPASPQVVKDGPFKVPLDVTQSRRKLELEDQATIALRTRSKLSLSSTSIEHIEATFIPPDDIPPAVDVEWSEFLTLLNVDLPARHEDDDDADPEYNVAQDPDAQEEDEEGLSCSILRISKKELNDLVTELFNIMPAAGEAVDEALAENLANSVLVDSTQNEVAVWEGKQEPPSDEENSALPATETSNRQARVSIGKSEPHDVTQGKVVQNDVGVIKVERINRTPMLTILPQLKLTQIPDEENIEDNAVLQPIKKTSHQPMLTIEPLKTIQMNIEETTIPSGAELPRVELQRVPPILRPKIKQTTDKIEIQIDDTVTMSREQLQVLEQQLRIHVQLCASNFLQLFVHPVHWALGPSYKEYLETFMKMVEKNPKSVVDVCNLKPALELVNTWEKSVSEDTPENREMIEFVNKELDRSRRRYAHNSLYVGDFHETYLKVVANSPVFLYPYLLPPMPYRGEGNRRAMYFQSEDELIVLGLDQFWRYVESNPHLYKPQKPSSRRARWGLTLTVELVTKHMFPWMTSKALQHRVTSARLAGDKHNPIYRYFKYGEITPVQHRLLPFSPRLTLYEQPEHELPRIWVRYLGKSSERFRKFRYKRGAKMTGRPPEGIPILGQKQPLKRPLPIEFTKKIPYMNPDPLHQDKYDIEIATTTHLAANLFRLVQTTTGSFLLPLENTTPLNTIQNVQVTTKTVNSTDTITTPLEVKTSLPIRTENSERTDFNNALGDHCTCCLLLRSIVKKKQTKITDYFNERRSRNFRPESPNNTDRNSEKNLQNTSRNGLQNTDKITEIDPRNYSTKSPHNTDAICVENPKNSASKSPRKTCYCRAVKRPKITSKLKLLAQSYQNNAEVMYNKLQQKIDENDRGGETGDNEDNLDDIAAVSTFQVKLLTRATMTKKTYIKYRIRNLFSKFNTYSGDPLNLAHFLHKIFDVELLDLYMDFLEFLTPDQAEKLNAFKDYFVRNPLKELLVKIDELVTDKEVRKNIFTKIKEIFSDNRSSSCEMCTFLIENMATCPKLAEYTFYLFPHRIDVDDEAESNETVCNIKEKGHFCCKCKPARVTDANNTNNNNKEQQEVTENNRNGNDSETFDSSSDDEIVDYEITIEENEITPTVKKEPVPDSDERNHKAASENIEDETQTENQSTSEHTNSSMNIELEDPIKKEASEWKREEDKLILEVLKQQLTPEEIKGKPIAELLEDTNVYEMLAQSLEHKSMEDVKERVAYLLSLLVLSETC